MDKCNTPVALICFKRIDTTMRILEQIAKVQPDKLYIRLNLGDLFKNSHCCVDS